MSFNEITKLGVLVLAFE